MQKRAETRRDKQETGGTKGVEMRKEYPDTVRWILGILKDHLFLSISNHYNNKFENRII